MLIGSPTYHPKLSQISVGDLYSFGMQISERSASFTTNNYRFGFNGYENEPDIAGQGNVIDFGARIYDSRLGRFFSTDPLQRQYPYWSPYQYAGNSPISIKDFLGMGPGDALIVFGVAFLGPVITPKVQPSVKRFYSSVKENFDNTVLQTTMYVATDEDVINTAVQTAVLSKAADPDAKIVIYGYSYGGVVALKTARALEEKGIKVDLLILVDAANGPWSDEVDRVVPKNVKKTVNFYQQNAGNGLPTRIVGSKGEPAEMRGDTEVGTSIDNRDKSNEEYDGAPIDHGSIDDATVDESIKIVEEEVTSG